MSRSSIFSFDSLRGLSPRFPGTLLAVICIVGGMELTLRLLPDDFLFWKSRSRQGVFTFFERVVIPKFEQPRVVVMGTSRAEDAVIPKRLDSALGLPDNSTVNLGLQGGRPHDALLFYSRHRERLRQAQLVILMLDEWHFSSGWGLGPRYALRAPLEERIDIVQDTELPDLPEPKEMTAEARALRNKKKREQLQRLRTTLLTDYAFNMRLKLRYIPPAIGIHLLGLGKTKQLAMDENNQVIRPEKRKRRSKRKIENPKRFHRRIHGFYKQFDSHPILVRHVTQLAEMIREDGGRLVLLQMPNRRMHQEEVENLYPECYKQHVRKIREIAKKHEVAALVYRFPKECGLEETEFEDYGHLAKEGAQDFTDFLADLIKENDWLLK